MHIPEPLPPLPLPEVLRYEASDVTVTRLRPRGAAHVLRVSRYYPGPIADPNDRRTKPARLTGAAVHVLVQSRGGRRVELGDGVDRLRQIRAWSAIAYYAPDRTMSEHVLRAAEAVAGWLEGLPVALELVAAASPHELLEEVLVGRLAVLELGLVCAGAIAVDLRDRSRLA